MKRFFSFLFLAAVMTVVSLVLLLITKNPLPPPDEHHLCRQTPLRKFLRGLGGAFFKKHPQTHPLASPLASLKVPTARYG